MSTVSGFEERVLHKQPEVPCTFLVSVEHRTKPGNLTSRWTVVDSRYNSRSCACRGREPPRGKNAEIVEYTESIACATTAFSVDYFEGKI